MPKVDIFGSSPDESLLHFDRHRMQPVLNAVWNVIREEAARQNPDDPDAITRDLCGGCLSTFMKLLHERILTEGQATAAERRRYYNRLSNEAQRFAALSSGDPFERLLGELFAMID